MSMPVESKGPVVSNADICAICNEEVEFELGIVFWSPGEKFSHPHCVKQVPLPGLNETLKKIANNRNVKFDELHKLIVGTVIHMTPSRFSSLKDWYNKKDYAQVDEAFAKAIEYFSSLKKTNLQSLCSTVNKMQEIDYRAIALQIETSKM